MKGGDMAWFKVDDKLHSSRKLMKIPRRHRLAAIGLWTVAGSWSADQLTDGHVPDFMIEEWGATQNLVRLLCDAGLWVPSSDGTDFKNWDEYQPLKADIEAGREKNAEKLRKWRERNRVTEPVTAQLHDGYEPDGNPAPDPTRPDPTHKEEAKASSPTRKKPEVPLPADWVPTAAHYERAKGARVNIAAQVEAFKLHAETYDRRAANWNAAFTSWLIKAKPEQKGSGSDWALRM